MAKELLNKKEIDRAIMRMAHEIIEKNKGTENICLVGIQRGGVHLARRLSENIGEIEHVSIPVGSLDISFYRDDLSIRKEHPFVRKTDVPCDITGKKVILVDDVLFTGRSIRAAMDALMDIGRPSAIQLAVLIDRGHRELPIKADYVGKNIPTALDETVRLHLEEEGAEERVIIVHSSGTEGEAHDK
ncbi:MAG TPA: bifunctional pyr operon transcriptional regulator/uracil phosphoribosyltransferase PyrR [Thermodesulfovibrionales bacterium]|nr:bifunctional pyr operon transcriptional regulator/uracil phosphoribosyltransferase PyrR [Thermodesulfovibrionales bacterium]